MIRHLYYPNQDYLFNKLLTKSSSPLLFLQSISTEQLNIKVKDADGNEVFFKVKKHTRLSKLKRAYAERMGKPENAVRFITADGTRIGDDDTADTVSLNSV
ncbi:hypothetical protein L7F22_052886 [Adiantum nelumboides]|nr:hypothetical protein [Adiantum nelumboides]